MDLPSLWALELSPKARDLLQNLQRRAGSTSQPSVGHAAATLRDALLRSLNELARREDLQELDLAEEREPEGTHVSPVLLNHP